MKSYDVNFKTDGRNTFDNLSAEILNDYAPTKWLKKAIKDLNERDVVDVLNELEILTHIFKMKFKEITNKEAA